MAGYSFYENIMDRNPNMYDGVASQHNDSVALYYELKDMPIQCDSDL